MKMLFMTTITLSLSLSFISAAYFRAIFFYNSKDLNYIGALSSDLFTIFHDFSEIEVILYGHAETGSGAKKRVVLRGKIFLL